MAIAATRGWKLAPNVSCPPLLDLAFEFADVSDVAHCTMHHSIRRLYAKLYYMMSLVISEGTLCQLQGL